MHTIRMLATKDGYLEGKYRVFEEGKTYSVDATLYKAFVVDLKVAVDPNVQAAPASEVDEPDDEGADADPELSALTDIRGIGPETAQALLAADPPITKARLDAQEVTEAEIDALELSNMLAAKVRKLAGIVKDEG